MRKLLLLAHFLVLAACARGNNIESSILVKVTAVMEEEALLPCDVSTNIDDDLPVLIMFYRNDTGTPIYTVDIRGRRLSQAKHKAVSILKDRARFDMTPGNSGLKIRSVWSSDNGLYRCRVDFKSSPTRNSHMELIVIVPPDSVRIVDINDNELSSTIGPYVLGMTLVLKCIASGGRPPPKVTWWAGHLEVRGEVVEDSDKVTSTLTIPSLQRHHLYQSFICQANNSHLAIPHTAAVTVDMTLPPMSIMLLGGDGPITAGVGVTLVCIVVGARPEPTVRWFLDGRPLASRNNRMLHNNKTESHLVLVATPEDQGRYLSCRAETPGLLQSSLEDGTKLVIQYVPKVTLIMDSRVSQTDVIEGMDVFFTCSADAMPPTDKFHWYHNNNHITANNTVGGILLFNTTMVLQKVDRYSSGSYSCHAFNTIGEGVSRPIILDVKYSPVCRTGQRWVYGVAREEIVHVSCQVDAHPKLVSFSWKFNNTAQTMDIPHVQVTNNMTVSTLTYTPKSRIDYGFLLCWATNSVGRQREPCVFKIFPAGPPDPLKNCALVNESTDALQIGCEEGFDGGLPQSFVMEVYERDGHKLKTNVTSKTPVFLVRGLPSNLALVIRIYAANAKGRSETSSIPAQTLHDTEENYINSVIHASELPSTMELHPSLSTILGVVGGILVVFVIIVVIMIIKRPGRENVQGNLNQEDSVIHILKKDDSNSGKLDMDEKDPDVIPDTRVLSHLHPDSSGTNEERTAYQNLEVPGSEPPQIRGNDSHCPLHLGGPADLLEGSSVADVSTIYGTLVGVTADNNPCPTPVMGMPHLLSLVSPDNGNITHATHAHLEPVHSHVESMQHAHMTPYIQHQAEPTQYTASPPTDVYRSISSSHMPQDMAITPTPLYTGSMPICHTKTLPHPRSHTHRPNIPQKGILYRRSSLFLEASATSIEQPLAPPPAYDTPSPSTVQNMKAVVPSVVEAVCTTWNVPALHSHTSPPENNSPQTYSSSFTSDRLESAV